MGYSVDFSDGLGGIQYLNPAWRDCKATSTEVWEAFVIPQVLSDYVPRERELLPES